MVTYPLRYGVAPTGGAARDHEGEQDPDDDVVGAGRCFAAGHRAIASAHRAVAARSRGHAGEDPVLERPRWHNRQQDSQPGFLAANLSRERTTALAVLNVVAQAAAQRAAAQDGKLRADRATVSFARAAACSDARQDVPVAVARGLERVLARSAQPPVSLRLRYYVA
ncbi:MAG: hypothetical protein LC790_09175 [Actinobacteria bacterium]|nr:hypothetical protein [Actinomycetota bacterium]